MFYTYNNFVSPNWQFLDFITQLSSEVLDHIMLLTKEVTASAEPSGYDKYTDTCTIIMFSITNH